MAIRQIKVADLSHFSIDEETNRLYWDGKAVQTESVVVLSGRQTGWAVAVAVAAILSAFAGVTSAFVAYRAAYYSAPPQIILQQLPPLVLQK